jgi:hypothetical protein
MATQADVVGEAESGGERAGLAGEAEQGIEKASALGGHVCGAALVDLGQPPPSKESPGTV